MAVVSARGVSKSVGEGRAERLVLDGAELDLGAGEMVAILGRSGSGKSTMLNLIGGLDRADAGVIEVGGRRLDRLDERELTAYRGEQVGFVFQLFHLIAELTAAQNVTMPARIAGNGAGGRATAMLERLGVAELADQLPHTLSGGEQQRVAIARALINAEDYILVFSHQPLTSSTGGEQLLDLLGGDPRVVAAVNGHTHSNSIEPRRAPDGSGGGYWLIGTAALTDYPQQSRILRLVETANSGVALQTWMLDTAPDPLADTARELAFLDAQGGRPQGAAGEPGGRNAVLYLP